LFRDPFFLSICNQESLSKGVDLNQGFSAFIQY